MAAIRLDPIAQGTHDDWTLEAGATKMAACTWPDDGNTTRIAKASADGANTFLVDPMPGDAGTIDQVNFTNRMYRYAGAAGAMGSRWIFDGNTSNQGSYAGTGSYADYTESSVARPGGGSWATGDFGNSAGKAEFGCYTAGMGGADGLRVTTVRVNITYTPQAGGYVWGILKWMLPVMPLLGSNIMMRDLKEIFSWDWKMKPTTEEEFRRSLEWLRRRVILAPCSQPV